MIECREILNDVKKTEESKSCKDCEYLAQEFEKNPGGKPMKNKGLIIAAIIGGSGIALSAICLPFVTPALRRICLPYVPGMSQPLISKYKDNILIVQFCLKIIA